MKKFTFIDRNGNSHTFRPFQFAASASIEHFLLPYPLSDAVSADFAAYARKAHAYMVARRSARESQKKLLEQLTIRIRTIAEIYFPKDFVGDVLRRFSLSSCFSSFPYVLRGGFCRGYVPVAERSRNPPVEFYFGTFGGGFAYYEYFSTRYRYRHLIILSDWWFLNGKIDTAKLQKFADWCESPADECPF